MATGCWLGKSNRTKPDYDYSSFPDEITEQILLKLPCTKSIVTCTSVCKSWHALIQSPRFVKIHRLISNKSEKYLVCSDGQSQWSYSIDYYDGERLHKYYDLKIPHEGTIRIFGSCNGLICYAKFDDSALRNIYMWNPAIRKLRVLPKPERYTDPTAYGFWFDTDADDYKVATITYTTVEVYSLSTNTWDTIFICGPSDPCFQYQWIFDTNAVHLNGTLHWLLLKKNGRSIISLNIKNRKLRETLICPVEKRWSFLNRLISGTHSHSLFLLKYDSLQNCRLLAYDESLKELCTIDLRESRTEARLIGVRDIGNEFLFQKACNNDGGILVCNVEDFKFKDFSPSTRTIFKLLPFAETLVLLNDKESSSTATSSTINGTQG